MTKEIAIQNTELSISNAENTKYLATDLAKFIKENKLYQNIQGKEHVNVEGWQYAGTRLGILPIVDDVEDISKEGEIRYKCKVHLLDLRTDRVVGSGFAMCSNKEAGKKFFQEYAIASMAQTRAIGKAYRNMLAWIIRAAGYEPTPLEEMEAVEAERVERNGQPQQQPTSGTIKKSGLTENTETYIEKNAPKQPVQEEVLLITDEQKTEIRNLLNNPKITSQEETKMLLSIDSLTFDRAKKSIETLKKTIKEREAKTATVTQ